MKFPKTIGACVDRLYELRQERLTMEKAAESVKEDETSLKKHLLDTFSKADLDGASGKIAVAGVSQKTVPTVKDWDQVFAYVKKHDAWDLLQRRVSSTAYCERLDAKEVVPGVEPFISTELSLRKR